MNVIHDHCEMFADGTTLLTKLQGLFLSALLFFYYYSIEFFIHLFFIIDSEILLLPEPLNYRKI